MCKHVFNKLKNNYKCDSFHVRVQCTVDNLFVYKNSKDDDHDELGQGCHRRIIKNE